VLIKCPGCNTEASISLVQPVYEGPYRCWKCRGLFRIRIEDEELRLCEPMSEEEFEKEQQTESYDK
jgi:hypothetical protein